MCRLQSVPFQDWQLVVSYGQCGGEGWRGTTKCPESQVCVARNASYSQCLPKGNKADADCWKPCGNKGGLCEWCGAGRACCRRDFEGNPAVCRGANYTTWHHQCVIVVPSAPTASTTPTTTAPTTSTATISMANDTSNATNRSVVLIDDKPGGAFDWKWLWWFLPVLLMLCCLCAVLLYYLMGGKKRKRSARGYKADAQSEEDTILGLDHSGSDSDSEDGDLEAKEMDPDLFDLIDRDHDGVITAEEFAAAMGTETTSVTGMTLTAVQPMQVVQPIQVVSTVQTLTQTSGFTSPQAFAMQQASVAVPTISRQASAQGVSRQVQLAPQAVQVQLTPQAMQVQVGQPAPGLAISAVQRAQSQEASGNSLFDMIDRNHDGAISMSEWSRAMGQAPQEPVAVQPPGAEMDLYTITPWASPAYHH